MGAIKNKVLEILADLNLTPAERKDVREIESLLKKDKFDFPDDKNALPLVGEFFDIFYRVYGDALHRETNPQITEKGLVEILQEAEKFENKPFKKK